jgi:uncharacterized membrane protein
VGDDRDLARGGDEPARASSEHKHDPTRVLALSDGVFAIIITLLVLDIHLPDLTNGRSLGAALREIRPSLLAFVISFVIRRTDRGLVWLNFLYLLPLCLLPFGASLLGRFDREPVALRIYGLVLVAIAGMRLVIWWYATSRPHLLWQRLDDRQRRAGLALTVVPGLAYLLAILLASVTPRASLAIYAGMPALYFLSITVLRSSRKRNREYADFT